MAKKTEQATTTTTATRPTRKANTTFLATAAPKPTSKPLPKAVVALAERAAVEQKALSALRASIDKGINKRNVLVLKLTAKGLTAAEIQAATTIPAQTVRDVVRLERASADALRGLFSN